jgi:hypothetical protein
MAIGAEHFSTNMYVLSLDSFDIVLGGCARWAPSCGTSVPQ